jgi:hypothetical protein
LARYLALIGVAAVVAALGVITDNSILIVGAMAVSPDLQPICATCVGIVGRRADLARRAFFTLTIGMLSVVLVAAVLDLCPPSSPPSRCWWRARLGAGSHGTGTGLGQTGSGRGGMTKPVGAESQS